MMVKEFFCFVLGNVFFSGLQVGSAIFKAFIKRQTFEKNGNLVILLIRD